MYCSKCGNRVNDNQNFCQNCGNNVQTINKQIFENSTVFNVVPNPQNIMQNSNENLLNYKTIYEKVLVVLNSILFGFLIYYFYSGFGLVILSILFDILFLIFIVAFGGEPFMFTEEALINLEGSMFVFIILSIILIVFNVLIGYLMYKNNTSSNTGFKVNKVKYLLVTYLLGIFGVHRFMIKDKKGGKIRLVLIGASIVVIFIGMILGINIISYLHIMLLGCAFGLEITDFVIALTKIPDNEKNILV